jgi:hypothetical protein
MRTWLQGELGRISAKSTLAEAIRYALRQWQGLGLFLDDGRVEIDSNTVERTIRPIKLGAKNYLFAGSDGRAESWATIASLIQTARLNDVEPFAYLRDVLERSVSGKTKANELGSLLRWAWTTSQPRLPSRSDPRGTVATLTIDRARSWLTVGYDDCGSARRRGAEQRTFGVEASSRYRRLPTGVARRDS